MSERPTWPGSRWGESDRDDLGNDGYGDDEDGYVERADVRVIDLTREQVGNRDRDDRGVNSIIVMTMSWSGVNRGQGDWVD